MSRHVTHRAVKLLLQPALEVAFVFTDIRVANAHLLEAQILAPKLNLFPQILIGKCLFGFFSHNAQGF